ncbi:hypothetical protein HJB86_10495 [Rhizobium sp. NZLR3b]|uniref:hypothetical protein n=1 Tax=Rhizobium sp. NZLR3b TaxID=2731101 RepID=UPI001C82BE6D|nr:hypothetical protein [Rhizobium sp. NZLR3b]MBX5189331.1 hypothetical protein [Rhizobium sp. NZLR3b]
MREQPIGEVVEDDDWVPTGVMWPPEEEIEASEAHDSLVKAVAGSRGVKFFKASLIDVPSGCSLGNLQIAIDEVAGEACAIYVTTHIAQVDAETAEPVFVDETTRPFKFPHGTDVEDAISIFCKNLRLAGIIPSE